MTCHCLFLRCGTCTGCRVYTLNIHRNLINGIVLQLIIVNTCNTTVAVSGCTGIYLFCHDSGKFTVCYTDLCTGILRILVYCHTIRTNNSSQILVTTEIFKAQIACYNAGYDTCIGANCTTNGQTVLI